MAAQPPPIDHRRDERLFISTTPGLEPALDAELRAMELRVWQVSGGAEVSGPVGLHQRLNLHLRTASRVLLRIASFKAPDFAALEKGLERVDLHDFVAPGSLVDIGASTHRSKVSHTGRIRELAARALKVPQAKQEEAESALYVQVRLEEDVCTVSVDTSGELLYRRGYRQEISRAPLRETLAAGMLILAGYRGDEPLWDPMCGSGTIAIEAALIARRKAPGLNRTFGFQQWPSFDASRWEKLVDQARAQELPKPPQPIWATDIHSGSLGTARRNAKRAGVFEDLKLERVDARAPSMKPSEKHGLLIANPPYGIRVGEQGDLGALYRALGALLRDQLIAWRGAILVPDPKLERALNLEPADAFEVDNGGIRCRLLLIEHNRGLG